MFVKPATADSSGVVQKTFTKLSTKLAVLFTCQSSIQSLCCIYQVMRGTTCSVCPYFTCKKTEPTFSESGLIQMHCKLSLTTQYDPAAPAFLP